MAERETTDLEDARSWDLDNPEKSGPVKNRRTVVSVSLPSRRISGRSPRRPRKSGLSTSQFIREAAVARGVAGPRRGRRVVGGRHRVGRQLPQPAPHHVRRERRRAAKTVHRRERPRLHLGLRAWALGTGCAGIIASGWPELDGDSHDSCYDHNAGGHVGREDTKLRVGYVRLGGRVLHLSFKPSDIGLCCQMFDLPFDGVQATACIIKSFDMIVAIRSTSTVGLGH